MKVNFTVHNVSSHSAPVLALVNGEEMRVNVKQVEVELVTDDPMHGTLHLRFVGAAAVEAMEKFVKDQPVVWEI